MAAAGPSPILAPATDGASAVILNASAYRFVPVPDTAALRDAVLERARAAHLKGTVLIAEEGLNLALAGHEQPLRALLAWLQQSDERFAGLPIKESFSARMPFRKLKVKVKREIITMSPRQDQHQQSLLPTTAVRPAAGRAPAVSARTLARWLAQGRRDDEGRPMVLLDTRNAFEVDAGSFEGAVDWRLRKFSDFPAALKVRAAEDLRGKTVVSYCTGGIRCEKAALVMMAAGKQSSSWSTTTSAAAMAVHEAEEAEAEDATTRVFQLDGGILRYLEEFASEGTPAPGWQGDCVVFDDRGALQDDLSPATAAVAGAAAAAAAAAAPPAAAPPAAGTTGSAW